MSLQSEFVCLVCFKEIIVFIFVGEQKKGFKYILTLANQEEPLSERIIKDIHSLILMNDNINRGAYRSIPVIIEGSQIEPVKPNLILSQMSDLISEYQKVKEERHIIESIADFHLKFETIHPFIDGNVPSRHLLRTA